MRGSNIQQLITYKAKRDMRLYGLYGATPGMIVQLRFEAVSWVRGVITTLKAIPGNPYGDDDESIAGAVLTSIIVKDSQ